MDIQTLIEEAEGIARKSANLSNLTAHSSTALLGISQQIQALTRGSHSGAIAAAVSADAARALASASQATHDMEQTARTYIEELAR